MIIGLDNRLKSLRIKKGISIGELSSLLGLDPNVILQIEGGNALPDINILPELCNILDSSIDYLLTGKDKRDIKAIGKLELCCKNDSVSDLEGINRDVITFIDLDGNDIFFYIDKYNSKNIFKAIIDKYTIKLLTNRDNHDINVDRVYMLLVKFDYIDYLISLGFFKDSSLDPLAIFNKSSYNIYSKGAMDIIMRGIKYNSRVYNKIFTMHEGDTINPSGHWMDLYSIAIEYAYKNNRFEIAEKLASLFIDINNKSLSLYNSNKNTIYQSKYFLTTKALDRYDRDSIYYAIISVSSDSIKYLLEGLLLTDAEGLYKINKELNMNLVPTGLFEACRLRLLGEDNKNKLFIASCIDNGLIVIDKLIKCNSFYLIKNALYSYPISPLELKDTIVSNVNDRYLVKNGRNIDPNIARKEILEDLYPKLVNKGNDIINEEYLISLLNDGNIDLLVIKLAVRCEAILKARYKLEGTFEEMINEYIATSDISSSEEELLHKLRKQRNSAVHADRYGSKLTNEELHELIEIIEDMSK